MVLLPHLTSLSYLLTWLLLFKWQDEYVKAYYAALLQKQREAEESAEKQQELLQTSISNGFSKSSSDCQVGMKSKREEDDEPYDDVEWEEAPIRGMSYLSMEWDPLQSY